MLTKIFDKISGKDVMFRSVNQDYFPIFQSEVEKDIELLRYFMDFSKFEREQELVFNMLLDKYKLKYCPSELYQYFSDKNKLEYCYKRVEIDDLLEKAESNFSDFL